MTSCTVRCGNCNLFFPTGEKNEYGEIVGYCAEFPIAGKITENCRCDGPLIPFKERRMKRKEGGK